MSDLKQAFRQVFHELAKQYRVQDVVSDEATFLFLLESPHVQELKYGAPVSGSSGASMTKHLFGERYEKYAIGRLVRENHDRQLGRQSLSKVGLMNVCEIPMQGAAYPDNQVRAQHAHFFKILEGVRSGNQKDAFADPEWNVVQEIILDSLRRNLQRLYDRKLYIIPCGRFAQKFFRLADVLSPNWQVIGGVPHPSYNGWSKPEYAAAVRQLKEAFVHT